MVICTGYWTIILISHNITQLRNIYCVWPLQWRHNGHDGVINHQPHHCLLNRLFRRRSKKTSKLHVTGLYAGNSPGTGEFPAQMASNAENVSIWWHHHGQSCTFELHLICNKQPRDSSPAVVYIYIDTQRFLTHPPWTKCPPFRRRYFQIHCHEWKNLYFD